MSERQRITSGGPWERTAGYSRAIVVGDACWVAGTTDAGPDGHSRNPGDLAAQTRAIFGIIERALAEAGFGLSDVVRTRMFLVDISRSGEATDVHGELFGEIRPASSMVEVSALIDPSLLIEIEADAVRG
jgi:enamine deaminase RidA (YjgF/YER057c/UK114 family)